MGKKDSKPQSTLCPPTWPWAVGLIALVVLFFWKPLLTDQLPMSNDASLATLAQLKSYMPGSFVSGWNTDTWLGNQTLVSASPTYFLLYLLPLDLFARSIYLLHTALLAVLSFYWLRRLQLSDYAAFFGSLVMAFSGSYLTYILPGHITKFEMHTFAMAALLCMTRGLQTVRWSDFAWAGVALGIALIGAADSGAFMAFLVAAWFCFYAGRHWSTATELMRRTWVIGFTSLVMISGITFLPSASTLFSIGVVHTPGSSDSGNPEQLWNWATQWSYPPDETVDLFVPGYHGWKTGDPDAPYWGALGRNPDLYQFASPADVVKNPQVAQTPGLASQLLSFWNFRLNSDFHGTVTLLAVLLAMVALFTRNTDSQPAAKSPDWRTDWLRQHKPVILFWSVVALVALVTSFGRHFPPPFQLLHSLPGIHSMRNPNKMIVLFTPAMAVLAAIGMDRLWRESTSSKSS